MSDNKTTQLTLRDHAQNTFQASLLAIPVFGSTLEKLLFGSLQELRMKRVEHTLNEVADMLRERNIDPTVENNEEFANFLETALPPLSRATNEDRRQRLRDLIFNVIQLEQCDVRWSEAHYALRMLEKIDEVGLVILAAGAKVSGKAKGEVTIRETLQGTQFEGRHQIRSQGERLYKFKVDFDHKHVLTIFEELLGLKVIEENEESEDPYEVAYSLTMQGRLIANRLSGNFSL
jgi:hypothetical protein